MKIIFESGIKINCQLFPDKCPNTIKALLNSLPFESRVNLWGDEIYFSVPFSIEEENSKDVVELGDIAYWPEEPSLCIFFGPTPISPSPNIIKPYSPVNVIGKVIGDIKILKNIKEGEKVLVTL
ncbi:MAG: cyclophilin-like fold protein [Candidatus Methanomethylicaceae archaeon]|nr:cyclophilin-like fold protein [Candidatus Verstraetearchaeota archaeon]